jgi:hypothetical protein
MAAQDGLRLVVELGGAQVVVVGRAERKFKEPQPIDSEDLANKHRYNSCKIHLNYRSYYS